MKKYIYPIILLLICSFHSINGQTVDMSIESPDGELSLQILYTSSTDYNAFPGNKWNGQVFTLRWLIAEATADVVSTIGNPGDGFPWEKDLSTPDGVDGGDGFYYQKFLANVSFFDFNIDTGVPKVVADIVLVSNGADPAVTFELVGAGNTWVDANNGEASINHAQFGEEFNMFGTTSAIALPITLSRFTANKKEKSVILDWSTSSEINGSHFEIERSQDLNFWSKIGEIKAIGESSTLQEYDFLDDKLPLNARNDHKIFYYRLNMFDNDGQSEYSNVRSVRFDFDGEADFLVYPNPSINEVYVNLSNITPQTGEALLQIVNSNGQLVKKVTLATSDDIRVDVSDLTAGVYHFVTRQGEKTYTQKVIKID
jgi:hypothetical protein